MDKGIGKKTPEGTDRPPGTNLKPSPVVEERKKREQAESQVYLPQKESRQAALPSQVSTILDRQRGGPQGRTPSLSTAWNIGYQESSVTFYALYKCRDQYKMQLYLRMDEEPIDLSSKNIQLSENQLQLWTACISRNVIDPSGVTLSMHFDKWLSSMRTTDYQDTTIRPVDSRCSHIFLFHLKFPGGPPGKTLSNKEQYLLSYAEEIFQNPNYASIIPQLVSQFPQEASREQYSVPDARLAYDVIQRIIDRNRSRGGTVFAGCVLSVLGLIPLVPAAKSTTYRFLLPFLTEEFVECLTNCKEVALVSAMLKGISQCMYWSMSDKNSAWEVTLSLFPTEGLHFQELVANMLEYQTFIEDKTLLMWCDLIKRVPPPTEVCVIRLLQLAKELKHVFKILNELHLFFPYSQENGNIVSEAYVRSIRYEQNVEDVRLLLDTMKDKPPAYKEFFHVKEIRTYISNFFQAPRAANFSLYKRLLTTEYDDYFISAIKRDSFFEKCVSLPNVSIGSIITEFCPEDSEIISVFKKVVDNLPSGYDDETYIKRIDDQLITIKKPSVVEQLAPIAASLFLTRLENRRYHVSSVFLYIDRLQTKLLQTAFVTQCDKRGVIQEYCQQYNINKLFNLRERYPDSWTIEKLTNMVVLKTKPLTYEEVEARIISQGVEDHWKSLLHEYAHFHSFDQTQFLFANIEKFGMNIFSKQLTIESWHQMKQRTPQEIDGITTFIVQVFQARKHLVPLNLQNVLLSAIQEVELIEEQLVILSEFLLKTIPDMQGHQELELQLIEFKVSHRSLKLAEFQYPQAIAQLREAANLSHPYAQLTLYSYHLDRAKTAQPVTLENIVAVCSAAQTSMCTFLSEVLVGILKLPLNQVISKMEKFTPGTEATETLKVLFPNWSAQLTLLGECLQVNTEKETLKDNCNVIFRLNEMLGINDPASASEALKFITAFPEIMTLPVERVLTLYHSTAALLYPEGQRDEGKSVCEMLHELSSHEGILPLMLKLTTEKFQYLLEGVNYYDEQVTITTQQIQEFANVFQFVSKVKSAARTYRDLVRVMIRVRQEEQFQNISEDIKQCGINLEAFLELFKDLESKEESIRKQIASIYQKSRFAFNKCSTEYNMQMTFEGTKTLDLSTLMDLKDRASLTIHVTKSKSSQDNVNILEPFVKCAQCIQDVTSTLNSLLAYGYPDDITSKRVFSCESGQFEPLKLFLESSKTTLQEWISSLQTAYLHYHYLTYLHGTQFWEMERYLADPNHTSSVAASLLAYMSKIRQVRSSARPVAPCDRLMTLGQRLSELPNCATTEVPIIYNVPPISKISEYVDRVLYVLTTPDRFMSVLLSIYMHTNKVFPEVQQVLFCTHSTTWAELQAFAYRCFTCPTKGKIYTLVWGERLSLEIQARFKSLFHKLYESRFDTSSFSVTIITSNEKCLLSEYFRLLEAPKTVKIRDTQLISEDETLYNIIRQIDSHGQMANSTMVVYSANSGVGKSHWISKQARNLINFPISGNLDLADISNRLLKSVTTDRQLHITISHVDNLDLLRDLLIFLSLFRALRTGELIMILPPSCKMYLELSNVQTDLFNSIPILKYLPRQEISFSIQILEAENPKLQLVTKYLQYYEDGRINQNIPNPAEIISTQNAIQLLSKYFIEQQEKVHQQVSYSSVNVFINALFAMLTHFEECPFNPVVIGFMIQDLQANGAAELIPEYSTLRHQIMEALLKTTFEMTTQCIRSVSVPESEEAAAQGNYQKTLTWEGSNHFSMIFLRDGSNVAIYREKEKVSTSVRKLIYIQDNSQKLEGPQLAAKIKSNQYDILNYSTLSHFELLTKLLTFATSGTHLANEVELQKFIQDFAKTDTRLVAEAKFREKVHSTVPMAFCNPEYVMTPDNFLKMCLIYVRAVSRLPIVIMGETGCGKTSLVRFFVTDVLEERFIIFNIHAGVTSSRLAQFIQELRTKANEAQGKMLWAFFDEFNTSDCVGQIGEILCERTFQGEELPGNLVLIAACNPFRDISTNSKEEDVGIKKSQKYRSRMTQTLAYLVKPLPENVREVLWDFGSLTSSDSRKYIQSMLKTLQSRHEDLFTDLVCAAQDYFRSHEDANRVSLRDVARFTIMFRWFKSSIRERKALITDNKYIDNLKKYNLQVDWACLDDEELAAGLIALCNCYYFRLSERQQREKFLGKMSSANRAISPELMKRVITQNENDLLARMLLPTATALNQAFRENVTAIITCIFNKIALFICGKPGCSKSLAVQVVFTNFRGKESADPYFRTLPQLVIVPFQGSETCTSESVEKVFVRAKKYLGEGNSKILPVVVFDEIGLAEISEHNPLKVLHSLLELENREVGFIGISNWRLDASKMNRAMYLARPTPDEDELVFTARSIYAYKALKQHADVNLHMDLIARLAVTYSRYIEEVRASKSADFYGLRDFYHLVKQVTTAVIKDRDCNTKKQAVIVKRAIERNFGGKRGATEKFSRFFLGVYAVFSDYYQEIPETPTLDLINENLTDKRARFLMLICKGDVATYILEKYLKLPQTEQRVLIGSHLSADENREDNGFRDLKDVILFMEKGISIILKDMDHIYTALYDLFNQNFSYMDEKRFCKVALGAQINPRCIVHDDFHVIVLMSDNDEKLEQVDAPFLNRFEKHRFEIDQLLQPVHIEIFDELQNWLARLMTLSCKRTVLISLNHIFPIYSEDYLKLLILFKHTEGDSTESTVEKCKLELLKMASEEILSLSYSSILANPEKAHISSNWSDMHKGTVISFILQSGFLSKALVFTYDLTMLHSTDLEELAAAGIQVIYEDFAAFKSKQDFEMALISFFQAANKQLYILDFSFAKDSTHLAMLKFTIEKVAKEYSDPSKKICLLARMMRNVSVDVDVWWFGNWTIQSISYINQEKFAITKELCATSISTLCQMDFFYTFEFNKLTFEAFQQIKFETGESVTQDQLNQHIFLVIDNIEKYQNITNAIKMKLISIMERSGGSKHWVEEILCNYECYMSSVNVLTAIIKAIDLEVIRVYSRVLFAIEKNMAFHSVFLKQSPNTELLLWLWISEFQEIQCPVGLVTLKQSNVLTFTQLLDFPFSYKDYQFLQGLFDESKRVENSKEELTQFSLKFRARSVLRHSYEVITSLPEVRQLYIRDFIKTDLSARKMSEKCEDLLVSLHTSLIPQKNSIETEVFSYMTNRDFLFLLCDAFDLFMSLGLEASVQVQSMLAELSVRRSQNQAPQEEEKRQVLDEEDPQKTSVFDLAQGNSSEVKSILATVLESSVSKLYPTEFPIESGAHVRTRSAGLSRLYQLFFRFKYDYQIELSDFCTDSLFIWKLLFEMLSTTPQGDAVLNEIGRKAMELATAETEFLYNIQFVEYLSHIVQQHCPVASQRFISCYYTKLLYSEQPGALQFIASQINSPDPDNDLWKHSAPLLQIILDQYHLMTEEEDCLLDLADESHLDEMEAVLSNESLLSRFSILLNDSLVRNLSPTYDSKTDDDDHDNEKEAYLTSNEQRFCLSKEAIVDPHDRYPQTMKLVAFAHIRVYLEVYCQLFYSDPQLSENGDRMMQLISYFLHEPTMPIARLYALKYLKQHEKLTEEAIVQLLRDRYNTKWTSLFKFPEEQEEILSVELQNSPLYCTTSNILKSILAGRAVPNISEVLSNARTAETRASFALAFLVVVYLRYPKQQDNRRIAEFFAKNRAAVEGAVGTALCQLIGLFVNNFPEGSFLKLTKETDAEVLGMAITLCYSLVIILSHCDAACPMTSVFFNRTGTVLPNVVNVVNSAYVYGVGADPLIDYLTFLRDNFETQITKPSITGYSVGSANKCSATCDFIYTITNCGGPMVTGKCPFCGNAIGGADHKWIGDRAAINLTDDAARKILEEKVTQYKARHEAGYWDFAVGVSSQTLRGISPIAHNLLQLFLNTTLYFLNLSGSVSDKDIKEIIHTRYKDPITNINKHFLDAIKIGFNTVRGSLSTADDTFWFYSVVSQLPTLITRHQTEECNLEKRTSFEQDFQSLIVQSCQSPVSVVQTFKQRVAQFSQRVAQVAQSSLSLLREVASPEEMKEYPNSQFFRLTRTPDIIHLRSQFELQNLQPKYPFLTLYFSMQASFPQISLLSSVIELSNHLKNKYSHVISRAEARERKMKDVLREDEELKQLFAKFSTEWEERHPPDLQFECHFLEEKLFTEEDELAYFMVDNQEQGRGMYMAAALSQFGEEQNKVVTEFLRITKEKTGLKETLIMDTRPYEVQQVRGEIIIQLSLEEKSSLNCSLVNNPVYGKGEEVFYYYQRLEETIKESLVKGRLLRTAPLNYAQYLFEVLATTSQNSDLISATRERIEQEPFSESFHQQVNFFFDREQRDNPQYIELLRSYYGSLESLLCFLRTSTQRPDTTIRDFASKVNRFKQFDFYLNRSIISDLPLKHIIALYELLETRFYPFMKEYISEDYKKTDSEIEKRISALNFSELPRKEDVILAMMRLIMRLLPGQLSSDLKISMYIGRYDLWGQDRDEDLVMKLTDRLSDISIANALQVYETLATPVKSQAKAQKPKSGIKLQVKPQKQQIKKPIH